MIKTKLHPFQEEAVQRILPHRGFGLFFEQRARKTLIVLKVIDIRKPARLLIVSTKKSVEEWKRQMETHGTPEAGEIKLINYEQLWKNRKQLRRWILQADGETMMVLDESHRIKKRGSKFSKAARYVAWAKPRGADRSTALVDYRLCMSGTPIAQGIHDAWAQFDFLDPSYFGPWADFEDKFLVMGGFKGKKPVGVKRGMLDEFNKIFHQYGYRRTLNELRKEGGIPPVKIHRVKIRFDLFPKTWRIYEEMRTKLEAIVSRKVVKVKVAVAAAMKLQQITGGGILNTIEVEGEEKPRQEFLEVGVEKLVALQRLLESGRPGKHVVIIVRFLHEVPRIGNLLEQLGRTWKLIAGGEEFNGQFDVDAIILQVQSGVAIDLSTADSIIFFSWDYSYINYDQTTFRVISYEKRQVNYFYLIANGTIDEEIYEASTRKKNFARLVCDHYRRRHRYGRRPQSTTRPNREGPEGTGP